MSVIFNIFNQISHAWKIIPVENSLYINKFGKRLFIINSHFKITHMPSYYYISLQRVTENKSNYAFRSVGHKRIMPQCSLPQTRTMLSFHVNNPKLGIWWQSKKHCQPNLSIEHKTEKKRLQSTTSIIQSRNK